MSPIEAASRRDALTALAFDFGVRRIGVAVGQTLGAGAEPLATIAVDNGRVDWDSIAALVEQWAPDVFVLGRPGTADGDAHPLAEDIARFARRLEGRYQRPVELVDEHLSSWDAAARGGEDGRGGLDAAAAAVILETWLAGRQA